MEKSNIDHLEMGGIYKYTLKKNIDKEYPNGRYYVGQSEWFYRRCRQHEKNKKGEFDSAIQKHGYNNFIFEILENRKYSGTTKAEFIDYHMWLDEREKFHIKDNDSYINGYNNTKGGTGGGKRQAMHEYAWKKTENFFIKFYRAGLWVFENEKIKLGEMPRKYCLPKNALPNLVDYKLGEELHKFRSNAYISIKGNPKRMKKLEDIGYTSSTPDNVRNERFAKSRVDKGWIDLKIALQWEYEKNGHINVRGEYEIPAEIELSINNKYRKLGHIINSIRGSWDKTPTSYIGKGGDREERKKILKGWNLFLTAPDFMKHKFELCMNWFLEKDERAYPPQTYNIPETDDLPKYCHTFHLGVTYKNWSDREQIPKKIQTKLDMAKKTKPAPWQIDPYKNNPKKKNQMIQKQKATRQKNKKELTTREMRQGLAKKKIKGGDTQPADNDHPKRWQPNKAELKKIYDAHGLSYSYNAHQ